jgi:Domain of unknown function (DUF5666)
MRQTFLYAIISLLMAAGFLTAVPAFAQSQTAPAQGSGQGWGSARGGTMQRGSGVFGTVTAISGDTITLSSKGFGQNATATTYTVDATNATVMKSGAASSLSAIAVGDTLMVQGTVSGDSVTATKINDGLAMGPGPARIPGVFGTVSAINGTTLTVTSKGGPSTQSSSGTTYTVDASNAIVVKDGATSTVSAIATGDTVMVQGTVSGSSVTATKINDGMPQGQQGGMMGKGGGALASLQGNGEPVIGGSVSAISGDTLTVTNKSNVTYSVDATNATVIVKNATSSISAIATGDNVVVQGTVDGTAVTASTVIDQGAQSSGGNNGTTGGPGMMHGIGGVMGAIGGFFQHLFGFF